MLRKTDPDRDLFNLRSKRGLRVDEACEWFLEAHKVRTWLASTRYQLLNVTGHAGTGKPELSMYLLDTIARKAASREGPGQTSHLAYFFCSAAGRKSRSEIDILRGILYQLCATERFLQYMQSAYDDYSMPQEDVVRDFAALWRVFTSILQDPLAESLVLVIDAIDSCSSEVRLAFLSHIKGLEAYPGAENISVKILVTCRERCSIPHALRQTSRHIQIGGSAYILALNRFIFRRVIEVSDGMAYPPDTRMSVVKKLQERNGGTFLWISLVLKHLETTKVVPLEVLDRIERLPEELSELYDEILSSVPAASVSDTRFLLHILAVVRSGLSKQDILVAFALRDQSWETSRLPPYSHLEHLLLERSDLVIVNDASDTVALLHDSVKEYLLSDPWTMLSRILASGAALFALLWCIALCAYAQRSLSWTIAALGLASAVLPAIFTGHRLGHVPLMLHQTFDHLLRSFCATVVVKSFSVRLLFHVPTPYANYLCFNLAYKCLGLDPHRSSAEIPVLVPLQQYSEEYLQEHAHASWHLLRAGFPWASPSLSEQKCRLDIWLKGAAGMDSRCLSMLLRATTK